MKALLALAFVFAVSGQGLADWMHPHYSFRCRESKGIDIFGIHDGSTVTILDGTCKDTSLTSIEGIFNISYDCTNKTEESTDTGSTAYEVCISVKDPMFDVTTSKDVNATMEDSTTEAIIYGGHNEHRFKISCLNIPNTGVNKTVAHVFQGMPHKLPENHKEVSPVEMHFKAVEDIEAPDISDIYIGDEFFMFLKYTGVSKYKVIPKTCTAYAGTVVPVHGQPNVNKVELWDEKKNGKKCIVHEELLASIDNYNKETETIAAKMYGFRFKESEYITIACEVGVFREDSLKTICPNVQRRKRNTRLTRRDVLDTAIHRKNIIGKLRIIDHHPSEYGNSASKSGGSFERIMFSGGILILSSRFTVLW